MVALAFLTRLLILRLRREKTLAVATEGVEAEAEVVISRITSEKTRTLLETSQDIRCRLTRGEEGAVSGANVEVEAIAEDRTTTAEMTRRGAEEADMIIRAATPLAETTTIGAGMVTGRATVTTTIREAEMVVATGEVVAVGTQTATIIAVAAIIGSATRATGANPPVAREVINSFRGTTPINR